MIAFQNTTVTKLDVLAQLRAHAAADQIIKGQYWENGKGCAVGCTVHSDNHAEYETRFGIPQMLARLEDCIFEGLPNADAMAWPVRFMEAVPEGADLSRLSWRFLHWLLTDETVNPGINHPLVRDAVKQCADVLLRLTEGEPVDVSAALSAAWNADSAVWNADSAARSAALSALSAARSVESAAASAVSANSAAASAVSANSAAASAESAALSAESAESAAYVKMADKLIALIEACA